jgi:thymidylate synthase
MLHCLMYQRSADVGLGLPYNITSYAILTRILAHVCDLRPGSVSIVTGDTHIYKNHIGLDSGPNLIDQVAREPREFPRLRIVANHKDIDKFTPSDFQLEGYDPHPRIKLLFTTT